MKNLMTALLLALMLALLAVPAMAEELTGQADGFASVPTAVFLMPAIMLLTHLFCILICFLDPGNRNRNQKLQTIVLWIIPLIGNLSCCGIYALALGWEFSPVVWTMVPMGLLFAVIGNYMPKTRMNSTMGIKVPWTYSSEANWNATHRYAGKVWMIGGILIALCGLLPHGWAVTVMLASVLILIILPIAYAYRFYKKEKAEEHKTPLLSIPCRFGRLFADLDNLLATVVAAAGAQTMGTLVLTALRALHDRGSVQLPDVVTSFVATSFGCFSLGYRHFSTSLH